MPRVAASSIGALFCVLTAAICECQIAPVALTSTDKHVELRQGTMLTLRTVALPAASESRLIVPPDRVVETTLIQKIGGKKCRVGDPVHLALVYPIIFESDGKQVRIPEKAAITGRVVYVAERSEHGPARLVLVTDFVEWANNRAVLPAIVTGALVTFRKTVRPPADSNDRSRNPDSSLSVLQRNHRSSPY